MATNQIQPILQALTEAGTRDPELRDYYEFHHRLLKILHQAKADMPDELPAADKGAVRAQLVEHSPSDCPSPLLSFDQLPVEAERFARLVGTVAQALRDYDAAFRGQDVPESPVECLRLARERFEEGQACGRRGEPQEEATLAQLSVDLALKPYLQWAAEQWLPHVEAQGAWRRGYCPVCGGAPDFASLDETSGARHLLCSRCNAQWSYHRLGCPFCGTADHTKLSYYPSEDGAYRLYVCRQCQRYLKTIDLREVHRAVLLPLERLTSVAMDAAALEAGYR